MKNLSTLTRSANSTCPPSPARVIDYGYRGFAYDAESAVTPDEPNYTLDEIGYGDDFDDSYSYEVSEHTCVAFSPNLGHRCTPNNCMAYAKHQLDHEWTIRMLELGYDYLSRRCDACLRDQENDVYYGLSEYGQEDWTDWDVRFATHEELELRYGHDPFYISTPEINWRPYGRRELVMPHFDDAPYVAYAETWSRHATRRNRTERIKARDARRKAAGQLRQRDPRPHHDGNLVIERYVFIPATDDKLYTHKVVQAFTSMSAERRKQRNDAHRDERRARRAELRAIEHEFAEELAEAATCIEQPEDVFWYLFEDTSPTPSYAFA